MLSQRVETRTVLYIYDTVIIILRSTHLTLRHGSYSTSYYVTL